MNENMNKPQDSALVKTDVRSRFFAQYWGTKSLYIGGVGLVELGTGGWNLKHPDFFLQLKPISKQADEDAINQSLFAIKIGEKVKVNKEMKSELLELGKWRSKECLEQLPFQEIDYLRSKGYALPFMEYSVEDLISFGWVRLL